MVNNRIRVGRPSESYSDYLARTVEMRKRRRQEDDELTDDFAGASCFNN
jgi:hypothetical protein